MARVLRSTSPQPGGRSGGTLRVLVTRDGHLEFAAGEQPVERHTVAPAHAAREIAVDLETQAVIDANRAKLAELRSQPYSRIPDFPDALIASATRALPALSQALTVLGLKDAGLLPEDALIAGASALAFIANWLADRGYGPDPAEPTQPPPSAFHDNAVGIVAWLLLDWIHRSMVAADTDDRALEHELDEHYPRWSRTDFEWDITRFGRGPLLNPTLPSIFRTSDSNETTPERAAWPSSRRCVHTLISPKRSFGGTVVHSLDPSVQLYRRIQQNRARERRGQR